jgi:hypothetical protein
METDEHRQRTLAITTIIVTTIALALMRARGFD